MRDLEQELDFILYDSDFIFTNQHLSPLDLMVAANREIADSHMVKPREAVKFHRLVAEYSNNYDGAPDSLYSGLSPATAKQLGFI